MIARDGLSLNKLNVLLHELCHSVRVARGFRRIALGVAVRVAVSAIATASWAVFLLDVVAGGLAVEQRFTVGAAVVHARRAFPIGGGVGCIDYLTRG